MGATSVTRSYTSIVASVLDKVRDKVEDQITRNNKLLFAIKKSGNLKKVSSGGDRYRVSLMYELGAVDSYSSFGQIDVTPSDGITSGFYDWRQAAGAVSISGLEEFKNRGSERIFDLLKERTVQTVLGLETFFNDGMLLGQGAIDGASFTTARTSPINGSSFVDPLPLLVSKDGTGTVGGISASTELWWKNQFADDASTTFAGFLKSLRNMYNLCGKGGGGAKGTPDYHICDQYTFELYESALAAMHHNQSYVNSDIPFQNVAFKGKPVVWDEKIPDIKNGDTTVGSGSDCGTWYMLNSNFLGVAVDSQNNFAVGDFVHPENQDAKTALVQWYGCSFASNRRKQGVLFGITTSTVS
jgi:hypothetical protein